MDQLQNYLLIAAVLFSLGLMAVITRRNGVAVLMGVELILNAANINLVAFARFGGMNYSGQIFALFCYRYGCSRGCCRSCHHHQYLQQLCVH